jgi:glyoxylase-like metal-dependent hydrolase (beta-lactamase superfamily II)
MIHEVIPVGMLQCNCSIVGDENTHEAMVIDPGDDVEQILTILSEHGLKVKQIVVTHAHIDHVGGAVRLKRLTGAPILLNQNDAKLLKMLDSQAAWLGMQPPDKVDIDQDLVDGGKVQAGNISGTVLPSVCPGVCSTSSFLLPRSKTSPACTGIGSTGGIWYSSFLNPAGMGSHTESPAN